jgi:hypothetical protein
LRRARIVLLRAQGKSQEETAQEVRVNRPVVAKWEKRFRQHGLAGLADAKGRGRKRAASRACCSPPEVMSADAPVDAWHAEFSEARSRSDRKTAGLKVAAMRPMAAGAAVAAGG